MGKITGFLEFERQERDYEPVAERIKHWREFVLPLPEADVRKQGARCMDCGIPFCHGTVTTTGAPSGCTSSSAGMRTTPDRRAPKRSSPTGTGTRPCSAR